MFLSAVNKNNLKQILKSSEKKISTNRFILVHSYPKSYIQFPETTGYPLCNQSQITNTQLPKKWSWSPQEHTLPLAHHRLKHPLTLWTLILTELQMKKEIGLITLGTNQIKVHNKSYFTLREISKVLSNLRENLISQTDIVKLMLGA